MRLFATNGEDTFSFFQSFCMPSNKMIAVASVDTTNTYLVVANSNINACASRCLMRVETYKK